VSEAPDELERLLAVVQGDQTSATMAQEAICPYRGLDAFREEDASFFFGRGSTDDPESPIGQLVRKVRDHPFVMVVGRSGSGKSSLVYAGLVPALRRERDPFWNVLFLRPGPTPLRALAAAFNPRAENEGAAEYATKITNEADKLRAGAPELLSHMIREQLDQAEGKPDRLLLYIDQWEELYAQAPPRSEKERAAQHAADVNRFIDLLLTASRTAPVAVVATVRADFYDPLIAHQEVKSLLPTRQVLLGSMLRSDLERTIVEPARKVGLTFDPPGLVQRILDEAGEDEGMLPLLQYALKESWALRKGNTITGDSYARSGGVREAIRITAERAFEALSAEEQQAARRLFLRLVTPGEGQEDTRARAEMPAEPAQRKIVELFAGPRTRLLVTGSDLTKRPTVEVAHEALIRTWPRFRDWIDANREKLRARAAVLQAKADWEQNGRRDDMLLPAGLQLERARSLPADAGDITTDDIKEFISLSSAREETALKQAANAQRKRLLIRVIALAGVSCLALLAGLAYWQFQTAESNFGIARETADNMIVSAAQGLRNVQGINVRTIDIVLGPMDKSIDKLTESHRNTPLIDLSRASVAFEFAKTYQAAGDRAAALKRATESLAIRGRITKYDQRESSPQAFEASSADWRWELSRSLELIGDLKREEAKEHGIEEEKKRLRQEAFKWFSEALAVRQRLAKTSPDKDEWVVGTSQSFVRLGDLNIDEGNVETAHAYYEQSLQNAALFLSRRPKSTKLQRELSWNFNKVGDIKLRVAERKARNEESFRKLTEAALGDFNNSLCIRRKLASSETGNVLFKRDVSYALLRIGDARLMRAERSDAEAAYFEALTISLELLDDDPHDARYVDDVVASLQKIGSIYRTAEPEQALAFYQYAADLRTSALEWAFNKKDAQARLEANQRIIDAVQSQIDAAERARLTGLWWRVRVKEAVDHFIIRQAGLERNPEECWDAVTASVQKIIRAARH
jgi:conflict system STAND superfamily ATPase